MTRRLVVLGGLSLLAVAALFGFALFMWPTDGQASPGRVITVHHVSQIPPLSPEASTEDRFYLVRLADDAEGHPVLRAIYRVTPQGYLGIQNGCTVLWRPAMRNPANGQLYDGVFRDPCSGATFATDGTLIEGNAAGNLNQFKVTTYPESDNALVDTRTLICSSPRMRCVRASAR